MKKEDLTGRRFGRLVVVEKIGRAKDGSAIYRCACDCGREANVISYVLRRGDTHSCGCLRAEMASARMHALNDSRPRWERRTRCYSIWRAMKTRCYNPNAEGFKYYGARGITVCEAWRRSFETFYAWSLKNGFSEQPKNTPTAEILSIDRIDNDKGYSPDNCRWVPLGRQSANRRYCKNR